MAKRVSVAPEPRLIIDGRSSPKRRRASPQAISDEQIETFFATLTETCNVVRSAKAAGFTPRLGLSQAQARRGVPQRLGRSGARGLCQAGAGAAGAGDQRHAEAGPDRQRQRPCDARIFHRARRRAPQAPCRDGGQRRYDPARGRAGGNPRAHPGAAGPDPGAGQRPNRTRRIALPAGVRRAEAE